MWLYGFMTNVRSCRKLEAACRDQIPYLWLTGWQHPDHNTLWRFYQRTPTQPDTSRNRPAGAPLRPPVIDGIEEHDFLESGLQCAFTPLAGARRRQRRTRSMVHGKNRISYRIDRRLSGLAGPDYDATISFGLPIEPEDSQYGECRL